MVDLRHDKAARDALKESDRLFKVYLDTKPRDQRLAEESFVLFQVWQKMTKRESLPPAAATTPTSTVGTNG